MRYLRARWLVLVLAAFVGGCGLTDLDINTDPDAATEVPGDLLFPTALATIGANRSIEISPGTALFVQIMASSGSAGVFLDPERYTLSSFTVGNAWSAFYGTTLRNLTLMREQALAADPVRANVAAQSEIMSAYVFWMLTSLWETVPFTQALDGATYPQPVFDDQETVLRGIVTRLDEAIARIDENGVPGVAFGDMVYGGDMERWRRFANSLKLRTLMMIRNKDTSVDSQIGTLLGQPLIRENAQEAAIPFFNTVGNENNVWKLNNQFAGFVNAPNGNQFLFAGEVFVDLMKSLGDPRLDTYFTRAVRDFNISPDGGGTATDEHFGKPAGMSGWNDGQTSMVSQNIIRRNWPGRILPAAEVWLYEAEFRAAQGDLGAARASYLAGVQRALDYFDDKPGTISTAAKNAYLASLPGSFASQAAAFDAIHAQQYIEVFDRSPENWTEWRRTKYPALQLPAQAVLGDIIRRYSMPTDEQSSNPNTPVGIPLDRPMWFER